MLRYRLIGEWRLLAAFIGTIAVPSYLTAQMMQPPVTDSSSATGLNYKSLQFRLEEEDLSIGGEGREGLTLRRSFIDTVSANPGMYRSPGWVDNYATYITNAPVPTYPGEEPVPAYQQTWVYRISVGTKTYAFTGGTTSGNARAASHVPWGVYQSALPNGTAVIYNGTTSSGYYTLTEADGTITNFTPGGVGGKVSDITYPDGTRLNLTYLGGSLKSVFSSRGWGILFDGPTKACAVNLALNYLTSTSTCPANAQAAIYGYTSGTFRPAVQLLTSVTKNGATTIYGYSATDHLVCVKDPGQSVCRIKNTYGSCPVLSSDPSYTAYERNWREPIVSQETGDGRVFTYIGESLCKDDDPSFVDQSFRGNSVKVTSNGASRRIDVGIGGVPMTLVDELNRTSQFEQFSSTPAPDVAEMSGIITPEGDRTDYTRDARGNVTQMVRQAKPGSVLASQTISAVFPATCTNPLICNKPTSVTNANGSVTTFTYDPSHGGVLSEALPSVGGVIAVKRYGYAQAYAWLRTATGGYTRAATPVWLLAEERTCRATATWGTACAGGPSDEIVTSYEYEIGGASAPSNLLLRGIAVTADGQTRRTCYGYDATGNRIWETKPRAGLAACY